MMEQKGFAAVHFETVTADGETTQTLITYAVTDINIYRTGPTVVVQPK